MTPSSNHISLAAGVKRNHGLEAMRNALGLSQPSLEHSLHQPTGPILVALDSENISSRDQRRKPSGQVGLAIFDPHCETIHTHNFISGPVESSLDVAPRFLFGTSVHVEKSDVKNHVESVRPGRDTILVGHSLHNELAMLKSLGISLSCTYALDTQCIALETFPWLVNPPSPRHLGNAKGISSALDHCAGNDVTSRS
jgi:hypothetical protein